MMGKGKLKTVIGILLPLADILFVYASAVFSLFATTGDFQFSLPVDLWIKANILLAIAVFALVGLYSMIFASVNIIDGIRVGLASGAIGFINLIFSVAYGYRHGIGVSCVIVYTALLFCLVGTSRFSKRIVRATRRWLRKRRSNKKHVMVVGGGEAGTALIKEMVNSAKVEYLPVCILDDNPSLTGRKIYGVKVAGTMKDVKEAVHDYDVEQIFIAMPSVGKKTVSDIIRRCQATGVPVKVLPGIYQLASGQVNVSQLRQVDIVDLLGRDQVQVNLDEIMEYIERKTVLVTGGGGSIGSELCRQIASHNPKQLIIFDIYENNAYEIEQELKRKYADLNLLVLIGSIRDRGKVRDLFEKHRPEIVFNAAAHKHVPLMETSPNEAVKNNVFGTLNVARAADEFGVKTFVQISTDKAVNPTNIMGASKRICEMIVQTIGKHSKTTNFVAVRFGNVLGSNGSVIPLFKKQIAEGGPVTVTHKDIIRYFMTIPEAVSLVLQAGAYAKGGQIFVLDMGEPVKIYDLAYNLIKLSGLEPGVDIEIKCTGLRPGEKLFEERLMEEEGLQKTANGLISVAKPIPLDEDNLWSTLDEMYAQAYSETDGMKESVKKLVPTYTIDKREQSAVEYLKTQSERETAV
ncbi:MAG: polysaccharide biosynthesis protein [Clostridia bacterium]|nr:polysaccharide biosynthesis protein [Clostridia bacterium]